MSGVLKIIAAAAVILGGGYVGLLLAANLDVRAKQIEQFRLALTHMGFCISFLKMPVAQALRGAARSCSGAVGRVLSGAAEEIYSSGAAPSAAMERAVLKNRSALCISDSDAEIIREFAANLGTGDTENEMGNINAACARLAVAQTAAEGDRDRRGKLWRGMGLLCGMFAAVLLF